MSRHTPVARKLRRPLTPAEHKLWEHLRDRRLDGLKFRRQTPIAGYVADFCCLDARLIVELDGGGHAEPEQVVRDAERTQTLEAAGFLVIRFWNNDAMTRTTAVLDAILDSVVAATRRGKG